MVKKEQMEFFDLIIYGMIAAGALQMVVLYLFSNDILAALPYLILVGIVTFVVEIFLYEKYGPFMI